MRPGPHDTELGEAQATFAYAFFSVCGNLYPVKTRLYEAIAGTLDVSVTTARQLIERGRQIKERDWPKYSDYYRTKAVSENDPWKRDSWIKVANAWDRLASPEIGRLQLNMYDRRSAAGAV